MMIAGGDWTEKAVTELADRLSAALASGMTT